MITIPGPLTFRMGSPAETEPGRDFGEDVHSRLIPRSFAISAHEVTVAQYLGFLPDFDYAKDNAMEWCQDKPNPYPEGSAAGSFADERWESPGPETPRAGRGAAYGSFGKALRSAKRFAMLPTTAYSTNGFRVARTVAR